LTRRLWPLPAAFAAAITAVPAAAAALPALLSDWVQMAPGGAVEVRAVVGAKTCPDIVIDGARRAMRERAAAGPGFPDLLCAATLVPGTRSVSVLGRRLPVPAAAPQRIVVLGDTGCRIDGLIVQACNDPAKWPFPHIATVAAHLKPDLVLHVGDYLYRESSCPLRISACAGSPSGDNWPSWAADFFTPAAPLLAAAPFVFVRGNHEECARSGMGWLRLLGPLAFDPKAPCTDHVTPWSLSLGGITLAVMDDAHASDVLAPDDLVTMYRADLEAVGHIAPAPVWLVMHRPVWGIIDLPLGMVVGGNRTMIAAQDRTGIPANVALLLAGHIHTFEAINYEKGAPPQIIAGEGGDLLNKAPRDLSGRNVGALRIASGLSLPGFGFLLFTREANSWLIHVMSENGAQEALCVFAGRRLDCNTR
jgi:predicted phosphodiesterase